MNVSIVRSRRKTFSLCVTGEGELLVRAPFRAKQSEIDGLIRRHESWIARRMLECGNAKRPDLADGAVLTLFGKEYEIACGRTGIEGARIFLPREGREAALGRLLKKFAFENMAAYTRQYAAAGGLTYAGVRIGSARGRWGSCNERGEIAYSFRIAFLSEDLARYVAVHELCHTVQLNHGAAFWREVGRLMPDWRARRKRLKASAFVMQYC